VKKALSLILPFLLLLAAQLAVAGPVEVFVSILPQKYFVEKISGALVDVSVMVQPGASPATYEPKPRQMVALANTKIYFAIGVPFEATWLERIAATNPGMRIVHTEAGIEKMAMKSHRHHEDAEPRHNQYGIKDPHVWLSPPLARQQARNIFDALVAFDPIHRPSYETNYDKFIMELVDLDLELKRVFQKNEEHLAFIVFHPSWGYFARAYGLEQVPIEVEGKKPRPAELRDLILYAKERGIKVIFVQPQFSSQAAKTIAHAIGGQIAFVDPLAFDWTTNLREVAAKFRDALK
jgi:zinc transport system substrate-binding protein